MAFTGNENHDITLAEAAGWTANYRSSITTGDTIAHYFGQQAIQTLLAQQDCVGLRIYYALNDDGGKELIICGVTANEDDLYNGVLLDRSTRCPQYCGSLNPLNS